MNQPRFVVRECEGYRTQSSSRQNQGLSVVVLDSLWNYRVINQWRTEHLGHVRHAEKLVRVREAASALAAELNAEAL